MTSDRKKPGVAFWATVVVVAVVAYVLSTGPAIWISVHAESKTFDNAVQTIYAPIVWLCDTSPAFGDLWEDWWEDIWGG